jgi:mono/diheme cytochrome c family protein
VTWHGALPPVLVALLVAGCGNADTPATPVAGRWYSAEQVERGSGLYQQYCAVCHAADGSATAEWRTIGPDGHYPPPPLNGTAHTWHHSLEVLDDTIAVGGGQFGGVMPGFGASLDHNDRLAVIAWFQSLWPDEIYTKWLEINSRDN